MATGQPPHPGHHRSSPSPWASHTLWRQPLVYVRDISCIPNVTTREALLHLTDGESKAKRQMAWSKSQGCLDFAFTGCCQRLDSRAQLSNSCRVGKEGTRVAIVAHSSISWETDTPELAFQGLGTSKALFSSIAHATPTLKTKELKASEGNNVPCLRLWLLSVCVPPPYPSISGRQVHR